MLVAVCNSLSPVALRAQMLRPPRLTIKYSGCMIFSRCTPEFLIPIVVQSRPAQQSDNDDDEPGSSDTWGGQNRRLEIARLRGTAKQNVDRWVVPVEITFHTLDTCPPTWTGKREKTQEEQNLQKAIQPLRSYSPQFSSGPYGRRYDRTGFLSPNQTVLLGEDKIGDEPRLINFS
jgi:hypothetical protein